VPINHLLFPDQVAHILNDCSVKVLVTTKARAEKLQDVLSSCPSVNVLALTDGESVDSGKLKVVSVSGILSGGAGFRSADTCISNDLAAILYTSGSTGKPKGVMLSHANLLAGSRIVSTYLGISRNERILSILPFSFDYGLNQLLTSVENGATLVLLSFLFPDQIVRELLRERITGLAGVPPMWSLLAQPKSSLHRNNFPSLRYITNSGGAMPLSVLESLRKTLPGTKIFLMYGLTEAFRSTYLPPEELDKRPTSMGKAIPDTEIFVVNEKGGLCGPGEVGELVHRGPTVSLGYWGRPDATAKVLRPNPFLPPEVESPEKVCYSGDLVKMDEEGFLYFATRRDQTIKSSGYRISPNEVEEVIYGSGKVQEVAVIGTPDEMLGQAVKAFVVPLDSNGFDVEELISFCGEKMPRYMVPKSVEVMDSLPKTSSGKIDYPELRKR
jgi:acyl-CoA ligase (AMP-forming) (exosortase A-associated)